MRVPTAHEMCQDVRETEVWSGSESPKVSDPRAICNVPLPFSSQSSMVRKTGSSSARTEPRRVRSRDQLAVVVPGVDTENRQKSEITGGPGGTGPMLPIR